MTRPTIDGGHESNDVYILEPVSNESSRKEPRASKSTVDRPK